ncbi:MAG: hypothetical protein R3Y36_01540 [Spirochaetales bacterium]
MKNIRKVIVAGIWICVAIGLIVIYLNISAKQSTMKVAFYNIPDIVTESLIAWIDDRKIDWEPVILDSTKPLSNYVKTPVAYNLLFTYDGKNLDSIAPFARTANSDVLMLMPIPVRISVQTNGRLTGTPILADHFQLAYNIDILSRQQAIMPTTLSDMETTAQNIIDSQIGVLTTAPIICAGGDDDHLIMFFSSLLETLSGIENWEIASSVLQDSISTAGKNANNQAVFSTFFNLPQVYSVLELLATWQDKGFLPQSWLELSGEDVKNAMRENIPAFAFTPFSFFEQSNASTRLNYAVWYMPSGNNGGTRYLTAPAITAMQFSLVKSPLQSARQAGQNANMANSLIKELLSSFPQTQLSTRTNLVPLNANAQTANTATADTRQLFAMSDGIIPDIARASLTLETQRKEFAQAIRIHLLQM